MLYINGEWREAISGEKLEVKNPATGDVLHEVAYGGAEETKQAIAAAKAAFPLWKKMTGGQRANYLMKIVSIMREELDEIAETITKEMGKPIKEAQAEVKSAIAYTEWFAEEAKRIFGDTVPASQPNKHLMVLRQPVGVVAAITPWNFPVSMITRKIAPAIAAGCTVVLKPAPDTPLSAIKIFEAFHKAELPKGVANLVIGKAEEVGQEMTASPDVRKITFTGSTNVGKLLLRAAADTVKLTSMELGGHAPFIVFADADLDAAVQGAMNTKFRNCGQTCISTNRIYVEESVADEFGRKLAEAAKRLVVGDGMQDDTEVGPLINEQAVAKVQSQIEDAKGKGGKVLTGGRQANVNGRQGYFYEPTVINYATDEMKIATEETFGPVAPIFTFKDEEEVIAKANDTRHGLASYFFTKDIKRIFHLSEELEYGIVGVNDPSPIVVQAPFGGVKESGIGREGGRHGIDEFLEEKFVSIKLD